MPQVVKFKSVVRSAVAERGVSEQPGTYGLLAKLKLRTFS